MNIASRVMHDGHRRQSARPTLSKSWKPGCNHCRHGTCPDSQHSCARIGLVMRYNFSAVALETLV